MHVTIAICTYNRAESLRRTLQSLAAMRMPDRLDWEVVIVNNNCTDHTDEVIASFRDRLPIRRETEAKPGQSNARNRAIEVAHGGYIVWTDDDVIVDPGWFSGYAEAFDRWPEAAVFGGPIIPLYEQPVAKWVVEGEALLQGPYAVRDFGAEPMRLSIAGDRLPYGANFAIRTSEQRAFRYNPELGLGPVRRLLGDETDVISRIIESGNVGYWVPAARVQHCISRERQTLKYISRYFTDSGETSMHFERIESGKRLFGSPRWLWRRFFEAWLRYQLARLIYPAPVWLRHLEAYRRTWGMMRYWRSARP